MHHIPAPPSCWPAWFAFLILLLVLPAVLVAFLQTNGHYLWLICKLSIVNKVLFALSAPITHFIGNIWKHLEKPRAELKVRYIRHSLYKWLTEREIVCVLQSGYKGFQLVRHLLNLEQVLIELCLYMRLLVLRFTKLLICILTNAVFEFLSVSRIST